jgi:membrane protein implicated in regulation of membrane protease activity
MQVFNRQADYRNPYVGEGVVDDVDNLKRSCRIRFGGSYWSAKAISPFTMNRGDLVRVVGRQNITLLIEKV